MYWRKTEEDYSLLVSAGNETTVVEDRYSAMVSKDNSIISFQIKNIIKTDEAFYECKTKDDDLKIVELKVVNELGMFFIKLLIYLVVG